MTNAMEKVQNRMEKQENKYRTNGPQLKEGDKVWLYIKNLRTKRPSKKLDYIRVGPFRVKKAKGPINYKLELLENVKIYLVFYILLFKKAKDSELVATSFEYELEEDNVYEVEKILEEQNGQYLIKWKNYLEEENTWELERHLLPNYAKKLKDFKQTHRKKSSKDSQRNQE